MINKADLTLYALRRPLAPHARVFFFFFKSPPVRSWAELVRTWWSDEGVGFNAQLLIGSDVGENVSRQVGQWTAGMFKR